MFDCTTPPVSVTAIRLFQVFLWLSASVLLLGIRYCNFKIISKKLDLFPPRVKSVGNKTWLGNVQKMSRWAGSHENTEKFNFEKRQKHSTSPVTPPSKLGAAIIQCFDLSLRTLQGESVSGALAANCVASKFVDLIPE